MMAARVLPGLCATVPFSADACVDLQEQRDDRQDLRKQDKIRQEIADEKGKVGTTIMRLDKQVVWVLMPEEKMYMEMTFQKAKLQQYAQDQNLIAQTKDLGTETVNGYLCKKTEYTYTR